MKLAKNFNFYKTGLAFGLFPIIGLCLILLVFWFGLTFFAYDINVDGIGFLYIIFSIPVVIVGLVFTLISIFKKNTRTIFKPIIGLFLILLNLPVLILILRAHSEISARAYLKVTNDSNRNIENVRVQEPNSFKDFGSIDNGKSKVIYFYPDYCSPDGITYPGIEENYLILMIDKKIGKIKIPTMHPGETHKIIIDKSLNLNN